MTSEFILKHNGQRVGISWIRDAIEVMGIMDFCAINPWASDIADKWLRDNPDPTPIMKDEEIIGEDEAETDTYREDLHAPLRTMYKYRKEPRRWY